MIPHLRRLSSFLFVLGFALDLFASSPSLGLQAEFVVEKEAPSSAFPLVTSSTAAPLWFDAADHAGVLRALGDLKADIERVTGRAPAAGPENPGVASVVIVGTLGKNRQLDALVAAGKLEVGDLRGKWESFVIQTVDKPLPGIERALVIAGSDKRGTIYGIYELSEQLGVSPWYWWADVPPNSPRCRSFTKQA